MTVWFLILMGQLSVFGHVSPNKAQISTGEIVNNTTICFPKTNPLNVFSDGKLRRICAVVFQSLGTLLRLSITCEL